MWWILAFTLICLEDRYGFQSSLWITPVSILLFLFPFLNMSLHCKYDYCLLCNPAELHYCAIKSRKEKFATSLCALTFRCGISKLNGVYLRVNRTLTSHQTNFFVAYIKIFQDHLQSLRLLWRFFLFFVQSVTLHLETVIVMRLWRTF